MLKKLPRPITVRQSNSYSQIETAYTGIHKIIYEPWLAVPLKQSKTIIE